MSSIVIPALARTSHERVFGAVLTPRLVHLFSTNSRFVMRKFLTPLFALLLAANLGIGYAAPAGGGHVMGDPQQAAPKDCTKDPEDPRCKDGK